MQVILKRRKSNSNETLGELWLNGERVCYTLEDEKRAIKVKGETRIPSGEYRIMLRDYGGKHNHYAKKFPEFHKGMLWLQDVPNFQYILIHIGNFDEDTDGCILVGTSFRETKGEITLANSKAAYVKIYKMLAEYAKNNELTIKILDEENYI